LPKKKILVVVAQRFNELEFLAVKEEFSKPQYDTTYSSIADHIIGELHYRRFKVNNINNISNGPYDLAITSSGNLVASQELWRHPKILKIFKSTHESGGLVASVCLSVPTLAFADVVKDTKVSFYPLEESKVILKQAGAILTQEPMMNDNRVITAKTQMSTVQWIDSMRTTLNN